MEQGQNIQKNLWNFPVLKQILNSTRDYISSFSSCTVKAVLLPNTISPKALGQVKAIVPFNLLKSKESLFVMKASFP